MSALLESLLDAERRAEAARHDAHEAAERARVIRGEPYTWPQVPWRSDKPARRRDEPRSSRFGELA
jgi:hypothetical protein